MMIQFDKHVSNGLKFNHQWVSNGLKLLKSTEFFYWKEIVKTSRNLEFALKGPEISVF